MRLPSLFVAGLALASRLPAQSPDPADLTRIAESYRLASELGDSIWPSLGAPRFPVVLTTADVEYLFAYPRIPAGFRDIGPSYPLQTTMYVRPRQFQQGLLATFPAFGLPSVVVVGSSAATRKNSTAWVVTLQHEHFHQLQYDDSTYQRAVNALDLSGGDQSGMWMLNFPFPYVEPAVAGGFASLSRRLATLVERSTPEERKAFWRDYRSFVGSLTERDRRYLGFQLWQEGISRYVELRAAEVASRRFAPSEAMKLLPDFRSIADVAADVKRGILKELANPDLPRHKRVSFYAFGAGLGLLLDQDGADWKRRYHTDRFALEKLATLP
jgi:hypothetical protein